jgi:hypothetical protein
VGGPSKQRTDSTIGTNGDDYFRFVQNGLRIGVTLRILDIDE